MEDRTLLGTPTRRPTLPFIIFFHLLTLGCGITEPKDLAGTHEIQSINGEPAPWFQVGWTEGEFFHRTYLTEVIGGHLVLDSDSSCRLAQRSQTSELVPNWAGAGFSSAWTRQNPTFSGEVSVCTFVISDGVLTLNHADGAVDTGSIAGSELTITRAGDVWVFRKE